MRSISANIICATALFALVGCSFYGSTYGGYYEIIAEGNWVPPSEEELVSAFSVALAPAGFHRREGLDELGRVVFVKDRINPGGQWGQLSQSDTDMAIFLHPPTGAVTITEYRYPGPTEFFLRVQQWIESYYEEEFGVQLEFHRSGSPFV